jgi:putative aldouronate transport system substrate-binding protein
MKIKSLAILLTILLLASIVTACGGADGSGGQSSATAAVVSSNEPTVPEKADTTFEPFGRYEEPVVMNIGRANLAASNLPSPDTMEDNQFLQYIDKKLNVQIKYEWLADPNNYGQKVNVVIASGDIPDVMILNQQSQLNQLVESDMVCDLTEAFNKTLSPYMKGVFDSYKDTATTTAVFDDKILAVPDLNPGYQFSMLWVRKDWMEKVGAAAPKSLEDVLNLSETFIEKDPGGNGKGKTIGIALSSWVSGRYNNFPSLDPIFGYFNAYPKQWIKDASGNITYGSIQPEAKAALAKLSEMYKGGLLDKEFAVRKAEDVNALLSSGKCGIYFAPWWTPYYPLPDSMKNNPDADWEPFLAPLDSNGKYNIYNQNPHASWVVVKKGYEHPEAVIKVINTEYTGIKKLDTEASAIYKDLNVNWGVWPLPLQLDYNDVIIQQYKHIKEAYDAKDPGKLTQEELGFYNNILKDQENPKKDIAAWSDHVARLIGEGAMDVPDTLNPISNLFPGQTKTMDTKWANLDKLESETYLKIIHGEDPVDSFDTFVQQWKAQGGDEITKEAVEALSK